MGQQKQVYMVHIVFIPLLCLTHGDIQVLKSRHSRWSFWNQ